MGKEVFKKAGKWMVTWFPVAWYKICQEQMRCVFVLVLSIGFFIVWEAWYQDGSVLGEYSRAVQFFLSKEYIRIWTPIVMVFWSSVYLLQGKWGNLIAVFLVMIGIQVSVDFSGTNIWQRLIRMLLFSMLYVTVLNCLEKVVNKRGASVLHPKEMPEVKYYAISLDESRKAEKKGAYKSGEKE